MKTYKINQSIEKSLFPIESKLDAINKSNKEHIELIFKIYSPVFLSSLLTVAFGETIIFSCSNNTNEFTHKLEQIMLTWWGKPLCIILLFICFSLVIFIVCELIKKIYLKRDNKRSKEEREKIANLFYKVIIPEIITGASLFEKAYEIECSPTDKTKIDFDNSLSYEAETICIRELSDLQKISNKASLFYYEAFYHFRYVENLFKQSSIIEYKDSGRDNLYQLYDIIGYGALEKAIALCYHCTTELSKRVMDSRAAEIQEQFRIYLVDLKK